MLCSTFITLLRHRVYATAIRGEELPNSEENPAVSAVFYKAVFGARGCTR